ncbi:MAG: carboxypeptidase-like regulatory domain-containing protein, partial [Candidatus Acidiferrum sp.]
LVLLFSSSSAAQETKRSAAITIEVKGMTGALVAGAQVMLLAQGKLEENTLVTDRAGVLVIELEPANYNVIVASPGFEPLKRQITVKAGEDQKINLVLGFAGCPPETCIADFDPPELTTEQSHSQTQIVDITSIELFSRPKTGNREKRSTFKEFRETKDRRITPAARFDVGCEVSGELDLNTSDFFLWASIDFLVAPVTEAYEKMDIAQTGSSVSWGQVTEMEDLKAVPIYLLRAGETRRVVVKDFDLEKVLTSFPVGNAGNLWPWLLRINIHIQDRAGKQIASAAHIVRLWPDLVRLPKSQ